MVALNIGILVIFVWLLTIWRVYKDLNNLDGRRNVAALILFLLFGYGVSTGLGLAQSAANISLF